VWSWLLLGVVLLVGAWIVWHDRSNLSQAFQEIGWRAFAVSGVLAVLGTAALLGLWRTLLLGLAVDAPTGQAWDVFFLTQLGKYVPGLVWPALAQMEAGRRWGAGRRVMLTANVLMLTVLTGSGVVVGLLLLPWSVGVGWVPWWAWALLGIAVVVCLTPRIVTVVVDRVVVRLGGEPLDVRVGAATMLRALTWAVVVWVLYGAHVWVLVHAVGGSGRDAVAASVGGMALGWALGLVAVLAPAGAGVRDGVLVVVLAPVVGRSAALAVALGSRGLQALADVLLAGSAALRTVAGRRGQSGRRSDVWSG
jgi:hypothetical protein